MKKDIEQKEKSKKKPEGKKEEKNKKLPKEVSQEILKQIFKNLLIAIFIIAYFAILNYASSKMKQDRLFEDMKVFAGVFLIIGIVCLEKTYKEDSGRLVVPAIEWIIMSFHTLSIIHVVSMFKYNFMLYLLTSSYVISSYFVLKCIIIYTKGRKEYLKQFSDISEIVKKEEPIKKEATKKNVDATEEKQVKSKAKPKTKSKNVSDNNKSKDDKKPKTVKKNSTKKTGKDSNKND